MSWFYNPLDSLQDVISMILINEHDTKMLPRTALRSSQEKLNRIAIRCIEQAMDDIRHEHPTDIDMPAPRGELNLDVFNELIEISEEFHADLEEKEGREL
jgi:hypothetical protein